MDTQITRLDGAEFRERLPESLSIYVSAMGYSPQVARTRAPAWAEHSRREGWECVAAVGRSRAVVPRRRTAMVGVCYGYRGAPGQWWADQVARGLRERGRTLHHDYVELTELHVSPRAQGRGVGRAMLEEFLAGRPERRVLLSTPEVAGESNGAWRLYRSLGFTDVLRHFRFSGDPRSFAVLGRSLAPMPQGRRPGADPSWPPPDPAHPDGPGT